jgi:predicted permease
MSLWRQLSRGLRTLTDRSRSDRDVADEVQHYFEQATESHRARGLSQEDAVRAARLELGSVTGLREEVRGYGWENVLEAFLVDVRYAARRLRAEPGFTAVVVLTLALGLGGATAIFGVAWAVLFEPLPYPHAERIAMVWEIARDGARNHGTFGMVRELAAEARSFEGISALKSWQPTIIGADRPERLEGQRVGASYFEVLGVAPFLGRTFDRSEDGPGGGNVVVLGDGLWRRAFGGDPSIIGSAIALDGDPHTVLGVMPPGFEDVLAPLAEVWAPLQYDLSQGRAWGHHLRTVVLLRPGVSLARATRELDALGQAVLDELRPETYGSEVHFLAVPLREEVTRGVAPALLATVGAVVLVLVIACANVTNLLLARDTRRRGELALRATLGAGRERLVRQLVTESLFLATLGGAVGVAVATLGTRALMALSPPGLARAEAIGVDRAVFGFALALTTLVGLGVGAVTAFQEAGGDRGATLRGLGRGSTRGRSRTRSVLVVAEVALALVLLVGSGLLLRSMERLFATDVGFDSSELLTMQVQTVGLRFDDDAAVSRFFEQALDAVRQVPGVTAAAFTSQLPLSGDSDLYGVRFDPSRPDDPGELRGTFRYAVSPGYFETMRIPLRGGRLIDEDDRAATEPVALVSESLAKRRLPGREPVGERLRIGDGPLYTVVGVVGDVRQLSLASPETDAVYVSSAQWRFADRVLSLVVRGRGDVATLTEGVREAIWSVDEDQPIVRVAEVEALVAASEAERRFALFVFEAFAVAALVLAAAGIYGVLSGSVAERTREIGVRSALGASRRRILAQVLGHGSALTALGVAIGVPAAAAATEPIVALLYGVSRLDPVTYAGVVALLFLVALTACALPAWRVARVDPATVLKAE